MVSDKVALVIGNQHYECSKLQGLFYPEKDAYDVAQILYTLGFKVRVFICATNVVTQTTGICITSYKHCMHHHISLVFCSLQRKIHNFN